MLDIKPYSSLPFHGVRLPEIKIEDKYKQEISIDKNCTNLEFITKLCRIGYKNKIIGKVDKALEPKYIERIKFELQTIDELGFIDYILMIWDICKYADDNDIPRGTGRGSIGGSMVAYLIDIIKDGVDPIKYDLFFSRFLNKTRAKSEIINGIRYWDGSLICDVDIDICHNKRENIINYINLKYNNQTAKILTTTTFTSKILIKDVLKGYEEFNEDDANEISSMLEKEFGIPVEINQSLKDNENFTNWAKNHKDSIDIAIKLQDSDRSTGQHASAILVCYDKIDELIPLQLSNTKEIISGFDKNSASELLVKNDILGLKNITVIDEVCKMANIKRGDIDINHQSIYDLLQDFKYPYGIFQFETYSQGNLAKRVKPKNFKHIIDCLSLSRPGANAHTQQYLDYIHDGKYTSLHPLIDDILKSTGGVILFQEQVLQMLIKIGFTELEAENTRRAIGRKIKDELKKIEKQIEEICIKNNRPKEISNLLIQVIADSAGYQFNLGHSANYATITAITIYLKIHYPREFYLANLRMAKGESDSQLKINTIEREMREQGYQLLPPHLIKSDIDFKIENNAIRFGLSSIKGISEKNFERVKSFQHSKMDDKFTIFSSLKESSLNIGIGSALIQAGCLDGITNQSRSRVVLELQTWNILTDKEKILCKQVADKNNYDILNCILYLKNHKDENDKNYIKETRFETIKKKYQKYKEIYQLNSKNEKLANYYYEKTILGYSYSSTLKEIYDEFTDGLIPLNEIKTEASGIKVKGVGFVVDKPYKGKSKKGTKYMALKIADESGEIRAKIFSDKLDNCEKMNDGLPEEDSLIIFEGTKMDAEMVFLDKIGLQHQKIFMKLSDLAKEE